MLWLNASSFAVSAALVAVAVPGTVPIAAPRGGYLDEVRDGLAFLWRDRLLRALAVSLAVTNLLDAALAVFGALGGGAVAGALLYAAVGPRLPRRGTFLVAFVVVALPRGVLAATPPLPVAVAAFALTGLASGPLNPILATVRQARVPPALRGRVFGASTALALGAAPLGVLAAGYGVAALGLRAVILATVAAYLATIVAMVANPALHEMDA